jgi:hypothetical protein
MARMAARGKRYREANPEGEAARSKRNNKRNKRERRWQAEHDVVQRDSGGAAARAEGLDRRRANAAVT